MSKPGKVTFSASQPEEQIYFFRLESVPVLETPEIERRLVICPTGYPTKTVKFGPTLWAAPTLDEGFPATPGITMDQFKALMDFVRDTRHQQQEYLETVRAENIAMIERYRVQTADLVERVEIQLERTTKRIGDDIADFKKDTKSELSGIRAWYASTIVAIVLTGLVGCGGIILSIWMTAK